MFLEVERQNVVAVGRRLPMYCVPGYKGIAGNEITDEIVIQYRKYSLQPKRYIM